jgi:hypothetical protein
MKRENTARGFPCIVHDKYPPDGRVGELVCQSSVILDYPHSFDKPGSSALWIGDDFHLDKDEVKELITYLQRWVETGDLFEKLSH